MILQQIIPWLLRGWQVSVVGGFMTGGRTAKEWHAGDTAWYTALGETTLAFGGFIGKGVKTAFTAARGAKAAKTSSNTVHAMDLAKSGKGTTTNHSVREKLFGTNYVAKIDGSRVRPINGIKPHNHGLAGKTYHFENVNDSNLRRELQNKYPHGVPFTGTGHPDFSRYVVTKVKIRMTGNDIDFALANRAAGIKKTPANYTWHHHHDGETMMLVPRDIHARDAVPHTGGAAIIKSMEK